jgi:hypothetical protein
MPKPNYRPHWIPEIGALYRLYLQNVRCSFLGCPWEGTKYSRGRCGSGRWPCSSLSSCHRGRPDTELTLRFSRKNHTKNNWILDNANTGSINPPRRSELYLVGQFLKPPLVNREGLINPDLTLSCLIFMCLYVF